MWTGGTRTWSWAFGLSGVAPSKRGGAQVNNLHSSFRLGRWRFFFCASQTPDPCACRIHCAPPRPRFLVSLRLAVALAARFSSSSAARSRTVSTNVDISGTDIKRLHHFFFLFAIISDRASLHLTITSCGDGTLPPAQAPSSIIGGGGGSIFFSTTLSCSGSGFQ